MNGQYTISIIGFGNVGRQICAALMTDKERHYRINVMDVDDQVVGAVLDFEHAFELYPHHELYFNEDDLFAESDFVFHCAGASVPPGESRLSVCHKSIEITEHIFKDFKPRKQPKIIVIANPVEVIPAVTQQITQLPAEFVVGTGTFLDSIRMDRYLKANFNEVQQSKMILLGEHGSSVFVSWQLSQLNGKRVGEVLKLDKINSALEKVKLSAHEIKKTQEATIYGVSYCAIKLFEYFLSDNSVCVPVGISLPKDLKKKLDAPSIYLSLPARVSKKGAFYDNTYRADVEELKLLKNSTEQLTACFPDVYLNKI